MGLDRIVLVKSSCWPVAPRGVNDLYLSWRISVEHARTAYHKTCGTEYQQPYHRRFSSATPYYKWNIAQTRPMSVSDVSCSLHSWLSTTNRSYSQLTFFFCYKINKSLESAPRSSPSDTKFWWCNNGNIYVLVCHRLRIFVSSKEKRTSRVSLCNTRRNVWTHRSLLSWWGWFQVLLFICW